MVSRFAFANDPGTMSNVISDDDNYYIVRVVDRMPSALSPLDEVRSQITEALVDEKRKESARRKATAFRRSAANADIGLEAAAATYSYTVATNRHLSRTGVGG